VIVGGALLPVLLLMFLFSAIALGAAVVVRSETLVSERFRQSAQALHAADAALDIVTAELRVMTTWVPVLAGGRRSAYAEGAFAGTRSVPAGGVVSLCCGPASTFGRLKAETAVSPLPARRRVVWQPFLWSSFDALVPHDEPTRLFVVAFVGEDEEEAGVEGSGDANGTIVVRVEAIDPGGLRRSIEAVVGRRPGGPPEEGPAGTGRVPPDPVIGVLTWREVR
jgi:hypothetical protein